MNNSEIINKIENDGERLKTKYFDTLQHFVEHNNTNSSKEHIYNDLLDVNKVAVDFFNHYESFVGKSDLFDVYKKEQWAQNFYETCYNVLDNIVKYYSTIKSICEKNSIKYTNFEPSPFSFQAMQRIVFNFLRDKAEIQKVKKLKESFKELNLPTGGFRKMRTRKLSTVEKNIGFVMGCIFIILIFISAILFPNPTQYQIFVFRVILSIAAAGIGGILAGFISVDTKIKGISIRAGGALALGLLVYLINPPALY